MLTFVSLLMGIVVAASSPRTANGDAKLLMKSLQCCWFCSDAFANGRPLHASIEFTPYLGGEDRRWVLGDYLRCVRAGVSGIDR